MLASASPRSRASPPFSTRSISGSSSPLQRTPSPRRGSSRSASPSRFAPLAAALSPAGGGSGSRSVRRCCALRNVGMLVAATIVLVLCLGTASRSGAWSLRASSRGAVSGRRDRILCLVPSRWPPSSRLRTIKETWGAHCDHLVFTAAHSAAASGAYGVDIEKLDVALDVTNEAVGSGGSSKGAGGGGVARDLWTVTHKAWTHVHETWGEEYDWFLKTDDDSFFIPENLRRFVAQSKLDPDAAYYLGHTVFSADIPANLGAGYVLSREALRRVAPNLPSSRAYAGRESGCTATGTWAEDNKLARCLHEIGIKPYDTRDATGRERFMPFTPVAMLHTVRKQNSSGWFWRRKPRNTQSGLNCCAQYPILWHGLKGPHGTRELRALYHLTYVSRVHSPGEDSLRSRTPGR